MKILFCAYDRPGHLATGPNAWIQRLIPDLIKEYHLNVHTLFIYSGKHSECPTLNFFENNNLPTHTINREEIPYVADQVKQILSIVKFDSFDVLIANLVIPAFYAARYLKPFNIPVIGVMHSNDNFYKSVIKKFIHGDIKGHLTKSVAVSQYINQRCTTKNSTTELEVIPCGTPMPRERSSKFEGDYLKVIYAGRLELEQKQILKLTNAFMNASATNNKFEFSIYGEGSQSEDIASTLNNSAIQHRVNYNGAVAPSDMLNIMSQHHVFTLMSDYEGMPVALMEAMACGLVPVCLKEESGINEIIEHGINGFIVNNRDEDYQAKLKALFEDAQLWNKMSQNAKDTIKNTYSSDITHQKWNNLLHSYKYLKTREIKIPKRIHLSGELLYYGDNRKPDFSTRFKKKMEDKWLKFKLFLRPRTRLRAIFKNEK